MLKCDCPMAARLLSVGYTTDRTGENVGLSRFHASCDSLTLQLRSARRVDCEGGMSDRNRRALSTGQCFNLSIELLRERLNDARAESRFCLGKDAIQLANSVVGDRKLPICSRGFIRDDDLS